MLLSHQVLFNDRPPAAADAATTGLVSLLEGNVFEPLCTSYAWNWQQGVLLQWHPAASDHQLAYNDRRHGRFVGIIRDLSAAQLADYELPLYAFLPDGTTAFSLGFARLAEHRPGYGYAGGHDPCRNEPSPSGDGIWRVDLATGRAELIISLAELASRDPKVSMAGAWHYVNHIQPSRSGKRIAFFHVWHESPDAWEVRLYTCRPDGSDLRCLLDTGFISHYDWKDDDLILAWGNRTAAPPAFLLLSHTESGLQNVFGENTLNEDGHVSFSPDGNWVLNDTYPDRHGMRTLMIVRTADARRVDIARVYSPKSRWWGEIRCDLHPRWRHDGKQICIDSVHDGTRQVYVADVEALTQ